MAQLVFMLNGHTRDPFANKAQITNIEIRAWITDHIHLKCGMQLNIHALTTMAICLNCLIFGAG